MPAEATQTIPKLLNSAPYFLVDDVVKTAEYYRKALGFNVETADGEPPTFGCADRDGAWVLFGLHSGLARPNATATRQLTWDAYIWVSNVDGLYHEIKTRGGKIVRTLETKSYGMREFEIEDLDGYVLCFGQDLSGGK
jgi:uncharacterized glyoxalase superfamily protein PhnB